LFFITFVSSVRIILWILLGVLSYLLQAVNTIS